MVFKKQEEVVKPPIETEAPRKDAIERFVEKLYQNIKSSKNFPSSVRELQKLIRQAIARGAESN